MASRVAIVDDSAAERMLWSSLLAVGHYDVTSSDCQGMHQMVETSPPDAVLIGPGVAAPFDMIAKVVRAMGLTPRPILLVRSAPGAEDRLAALEAGATDVLQAGIERDHLMARLRSVLRQDETFRELRRRRLATRRLGFAEDSSAFLCPRRVIVVGEHVLLGGLSFPSEGRTFTAETLGLGAVLGPEGESGVPDGFVLDWTGTRVGDPVRQALPELRARAHTRNAGILVLYDPEDQAAAVQALDNGASDAVAMGAERREIALRVTRILARKVAEDELRHHAEASAELAVTDPLTGLFNRRYADAYLEDLAQGRTELRPFALMMADIDRFKAINDVHGHPAGDRVLRAVADRLRRELRSVDLIARYGGEEFLIVLAESDVHQARRAADRLRAKIGRTPVRVAQDTEVTVTLSIGVCMGDAKVVDGLRRSSAWPGDPVLPHTGLARLIDQADKALYRAKALGRNRVQMAD